MISLEICLNSGLESKIVYFTPVSESERHYEEYNVCKRSLASVENLWIIRVAEKDIFNTKNAKKTRIMILT